MVVGGYVRRYCDDLFFRYRLRQYCSDHRTDRTIAFTTIMYKKQVLLSTVYGLNRSFSKQVITGFSLNRSGSLSPVIRIVNQDYSGVEFQPTEWAIITDHFPVIDKFFTAEDNIKEVPEAFNTPILMPTHELAFTYSYGERAIIIKPAMPVSTDNDGLGVKRAGTYTPTVVMKRVSYLNLQRVLRCVTFQITRLHEITDSADNFIDQQRGISSITDIEQWEFIKIHVLGGATASEIHRLLHKSTGKTAYSLSTLELEDKRYWLEMELSEELDIPHSTICRILTDDLKLSRREELEVGLTREIEEGNIAGRCTEA
ncbi:uncharacterized protein LOC112494407 [Cephus cinctus]|uniref:Uncharacterized protein LOC112494407 n=1 Tax=Cephus cinctus TaxID=211228 RepID=A0AAJ7RHV5_CEPCN|nr:uncharacterized protein LOC112494407 [Cephus cinctus]